MKKIKKYYPNNWAEYEAAPSSFFKEIDFMEFMLWKCEGWELPSSVCCLIREESELNGKFKIKEHVYQKPYAAKTKVKKLFSQENTTICVVTHNETHHINCDSIIDDQNYN